MSGESAALDIANLYTEHGPWLRNWLRARTRCPDRASDLVQDTFCRLLDRRPSAPILDPRPYLAVVARRLLIDDVRRRDLEAVVARAWADLRGEIDTITPEAVAEAAQTLAGVMDILAQLSPQAREAFLLRRIDGLGHEEIAQRLGVNERTVKRHVARAFAVCYAFAYPED
ncbi:sigma-70 family RNA polymerase sigma factor [Caulobacter segnis]|uniref:sigma-70 family RNA polymerase sigma factor n=1 Tax=Caulobacter segnis TaxID=88688 RepID=UPI0024107E54|nr:sigma-70 family RNA polymerase sigma factor [Caulobacter segnis]MDG2523005.1 sigma-70 family RNA polymerase sigma factor [Caulobacter segnis]